MKEWRELIHTGAAVTSRVLSVLRCRRLRPAPALHWKEMPPCRARSLRRPGNLPVPGLRGRHHRKRVRRPAVFRSRHEPRPATRPARRPSQLPTRMGRALRSCSAHRRFAGSFRILRIHTTDCESPQGCKSARSFRILRSRRCHCGLPYSTSPGVMEGFTNPGLDSRRWSRRGNLDAKVTPRGRRRHKHRIPKG